MDQLYRRQGVAATAPDENFCQLIAGGESAAKAYVLAGFAERSAYTCGPACLKRPQIKARVERAGAALIGGRPDYLQGGGMLEHHRTPSDASWGLLGALFGAWSGLPGVAGLVVMVGYLRHAVAAATGGGGRKAWPSWHVWPPLYSWRIR